MRKPFNRVALVLVLVATVVGVFGWVGSVVLLDAPPRKLDRPASQADMGSPTTLEAELPGTARIAVEVASTEAAREQGLSGRPSLPAHHGMLFVFDTPDRYGFWMKDMRFALDIVWLSTDGTVVGLERSVSPASFPQAYYPPAPALYALEVNAGDAAGLKLGDIVRLPAL